MKYSLVIAALLSTASAADGCKGLKGHVWKEAGCKGKDSGSFNFKEGKDDKGKTIPTSGKCTPHNPPAGLVTTEQSQLKAKTDTAKVAKDAAELRDAQTALEVCSEMKKEGEFCTVHKQDVAKFFGKSYGTLKTKYAAYQDALKAYKAVKDDVEGDVDKTSALVAYKANLDQYNLAVFKAAHDNDGQTIQDPMTQMILDAQAKGLEAELTAVGLKKEQKDTLVTLDSTHTDYLTFEQANFLSASHLGTGADAPNGACKSANLRTNNCLAVLDSDNKKCAGNVADTHADPKTIDNPSICDTTSPNYNYDQMKKIVGDFLHKDYLYDGVQATATKAANDWDAADKKLNAETFAIKLVCDKDKFTFTEYDDLKCEDKKPKELTAGWGDCVEFAPKTFIKMTGATALKAAAAALVAFAGSQF